MSPQIPAWVKDAIFYQIFPDRFAKSERVHKPNNLQPWGSPPTFHGFQGGDIVGVTEKLPYLADLGINALYFNPIFASASNHRYHTHDYFQIDPLLGTLADFKEMLDTAHNLGIRVILDGVFNHASRGFFQFNHLLECGPESPYVDWFHAQSWPINAYREHETANYLAWWGLHALPKFNTNTPAVREYLWNVGSYWLEQGIDGWRLDVPNEIDDDEFWREFRRRCRAVNPEAYIVGELWGESQRWLQGDQFDAQMNYPFTRAVFGFFLGDHMNRAIMEGSGYGQIPNLTGTAFAHALHHLFNELYHQEIVLAQMNLLGSHDTPRLFSVAQENSKAVELMILCLMTVPGAPNIYYGDEIGLPGRHDPDCRRAFPWDEPETWNAPLQKGIKQAIHLRRAHPAARRGTFKILTHQEQLVVYERVWQEERLVVAFYVGQEPLTVDNMLDEKLTPVLDNTAVLSQDGKQITFLPYSGNVWVSGKS